MEESWVRLQIYRVSQEECARLREGVPYAKVYRYNPKHLFPKFNGYGDNGQRSLKLWQLLLTYWLPNTYWKWQEYVISVMLIAVRNIKVTCEWHKAIKLNYKNTRTRVIVVHWLPTTIHSEHLFQSQGRHCELQATAGLSRWRSSGSRHRHSIVRRHQRSPHFSLANISVTTELCI